MRVADAVQFFWLARQQQAHIQGSTSGQRDQGGRTAVTGGSQMDGFSNLVAELLVEVGVPELAINRKKNVGLPGYFRPTKEWDLLVVLEGNLLASIEFKSQVGPSFGNNYNNRTEEALGSATDLWTAYREGAFKRSPRPWLGYLMLLEESSNSTRAVRARESHYPVFRQFEDASYARRYELLCERLVRERLYDAACLLFSDQAGGANGAYREPSDEISFANFVASLTAHVGAHVRFAGGQQS